MKKLVLATALTLAAGAASALEVSVTGTRDFSGDHRNFGGITFTQKKDNLRFSVGFDRSSVGENDQNRLSAGVGYDVAKFGPLTVTPRIGVSYLENQRTVDGYALTAGVGASFPMTKRLALGVAVDRQFGQNRVEQFDGNRVTTMVTYSF